MVYIIKLVIMISWPNTNYMIILSSYKCKIVNQG